MLPFPWKVSGSERICDNDVNNMKSLTMQKYKQGGIKCVCVRGGGFVSWFMPWAMNGHQVKVGSDPNQKGAYNSMSCVQLTDVSSKVLYKATQASLNIFRT